MLKSGKRKWSAKQRKLVKPAVKLHVIAQSYNEGSYETSIIFIEQEFLCILEKSSEPDAVRELKAGLKATRQCLFLKSNSP